MNLAYAKDADSALFERFRDTGDPIAFAALFHAMAPRLSVLARHLTRDPGDADDLVQATFVAAFEGAALFDERFPNVWCWLSQILRRRAADHHRARARERRWTGVVAVPSESRCDMVDRLHRAEMYRAARASIDALPASYRSIVAMRVLHGMRPQDIAREFRLHPSTVRSRLKRGLDWLRERMPAAA